jgi:branched-chain amino acid transport system substrate-binding protein
VGTVMTPAGLDNGKGILSAGYIKDPTDPQWQKGKEWDELHAPGHEEVQPGGRQAEDVNNVYGYTAAQGLVHVLKQAGDNLTRENIMKQAANLDITLPMLIPGVNVKTGPDDFFPIERMQMQKFTGKTWELFGKVYGR